MPLQPVIGRPAEVAAPGASLAAHQATRELPTAGPWAKFAAKKKEGEGAATTPIDAPSPSSAEQEPSPPSSSSAPAVLVQGLDFSYPDIGEWRKKKKEAERAEGTRDRN